MRPFVLGAKVSPLGGFVTFAHFTCQYRCALKDRTKENQSLGALDVGAKSTENGLFLASVTMPSMVMRMSTTEATSGTMCTTLAGIDDDRGGRGRGAL